MPIKSLLKQIYNFKLLAKDYGQYRTFRNSSLVDHNGDPIPWYTYPATEFLSHINLSSFKVFEYGSGYSTLWWAARSKQVMSVEYSELWYEKIKYLIKNKNVEIRLANNPQECFSIVNNDFDVLIVDGRYRRETINHIVNQKNGKIRSDEKKGGGEGGAII